MMHAKSFFPYLMGAAMGLMMLRMAHGALVDGSGMALSALVAFALAHLVVIALVAGATLWAARFAPGLKFWLERVHKPSLAHVAQMLLAAGAAAFVAHLVVHGGL